jgi:anti-sigma B factor antagonist
MTIDPPLTIEALPGSTPGTVVLRLTGSITMNTVLALRAQFRDSEPPSHTILDFSGVAYMDSAGMSEIIGHEVHCRAKGVRMTLAGVNSRVLNMLKITRLDKVLTLTASVEEAESRG